MSAILLHHRGPPPQQRPNMLARPPQPKPACIIEISDDDDSDDSVEYKYMPAIIDRRRPRVKVDSSPASEGSPDGWDSSSSEDSEVEIASPAHKRVKVRHQLQAKVPIGFDRPTSPPRRQAPVAAVQQIPAQRNPMATLDPRHQAVDAPQDPPYYHDLKLDCRMYRGPGYESFPVALGTVDGHQDKCDEWDAISAVEAQRAQLGLPPSRRQIPGDEAQTYDQDAARVLGHILEVLPDVEHDFTLRKIGEHLAQLRRAGIHHLNRRLAAGDIVSQILEPTSYPKESEKGSQKEKQESVVDETGVTIVWDKTLVKNASYLKDAVVLLFGQFPHVPTRHILEVVNEKRSILESYTHIHDIENKYYTLAPRPYPRHRNPRTTLEKKYATRTHKEMRSPQSFPHMVNELQAAKQYVARESLKLEKQKEQEEVESANLEAHKENGDIVECQCCFDDEIPMNRAVTCQGDDIHFFCFGCINQLANSQIGLMKYEMLCMHSDGCTAQLATDGIGQAVPVKAFDRLAFNQQQAEIAAARIEGLEQCPFCDFKGICGRIEDERVFNCQNPECFRATCRLCKEDAHVPKTCEEAKVDKGLSARHFVEEARTEAMIRSCPKCKVKIIEELGCNKMICNQCQCIMCYVCKADISSGKEGGYEHFQKPGAKCSLYDKAGRDLHEEEADAAEEEAIKQAKADDAELDEKLLRIETGKDGKKKVKNHNARAPPAPPVPAQFVRFAVNDGPLLGLQNNPVPPRDRLGHLLEQGDQDLRRRVRNLEERRDRIARDLQEVGRQGLAAGHQGLVAGRQGLAAAAGDPAVAQAQADNQARILQQQIRVGREQAYHDREAEMQQQIATIAARQRQQDAIQAAQQAAAVNRPVLYPDHQAFMLPAIQAGAPFGMFAQPNMGNYWMPPQGAPMAQAALVPADNDDGEFGGFDNHFEGFDQFFGGANHVYLYPGNQHPGNQHPGIHHPGN